jgi:hypothetical protein
MNSTPYVHLYLGGRQNQCARCVCRCRLLFMCITTLIAWTHSRMNIHKVVYHARPVVGWIGRL